MRLKCCGVNPAYLHFLMESALSLCNTVLIFCIYGHQVQPDEPYRRGCQLTEAQADALLRKDLAKFCALYSQYGKDSVLLGALACSCDPGVVNKSSILKKLKAGDRNIFKAYTFHCRYRGKWHKELHIRRLTEIGALYQL